MEEERGQNVDLPLEIMQDIIFRLPVKPLCRFKLVSKPWRYLISDPDFIASYSKAIENKDVFISRRRLLFTVFFPGGRDRIYSLDLDQLIKENRIVDVDGIVAAPTGLEFVSEVPGWLAFVYYSSYGLLLSQVHSKGYPTFSLINPVTKGSKTLPRPPMWRLPLMKPSKCARRDLYSVEFVHSTNEYRVINVQVYDDGIVFSIYTLQTDSWRRIDGVHPYMALQDGIVVNGAVHWMGKRTTGGSHVIISFLLAEEEVREFPIPPIIIRSARGCGGRLTAFRNELCITSAAALSEQEVGFNEFWVMKEYGVRESWTMMQVSKPYYDLSHSGFWTETHDLMVFDKRSLVMYNFNDGTYRNIAIRELGKDGYFGSVGIYLESILPSLIDQEAQA